MKAEQATVNSALIEHRMPPGHHRTLPCGAGEDRLAGEASRATLWTPSEQVSSTSAIFFSWTGRKSRAGTARQRHTDGMTATTTKRTTATTNRADKMATEGTSVSEYGWK